MNLSVIESFIDQGGRRLGVERRTSANGTFEIDRRIGSERRSGTSDGHRDPDRRAVSERRCGEDRRDFRHLNIRKANERRKLFTVTIPA